MTRVWGERLAQMGIIALASAIIWGAWEFSFGADILPNFTAGSTILLSLLLIARSFVGAGRWQSEKIHLDLSYAALKPFLVAGLVIVYVFVIFELGYFASTLLFLILATLIAGIRDVKLIATTAVILLPLMYAFFELFLHASLPRGILM